MLLIFFLFYKESMCAFLYYKGLKCIGITPRIKVLNSIGGSMLVPKNERGSLGSVSKAQKVKFYL
jgi:hypothetical protein